MSNSRQWQPQYTDIDDVEPIGPHTHLCPECFEDVPCEMDCSWRDYTNHLGQVAAHPVVCDRCEAAKHQMFFLGEGI